MRVCVCVCVCRTGAVANFAETEQILTIEGPPDHPLAGTTTAYVLVRGSIPLLWTQLPNIKYKPTTVIAPSDLSGPVSDGTHTHIHIHKPTTVTAPSDLSGPVSDGGHT